MGEERVLWQGGWQRRLLPDGNLAGKREVKIPGLDEEYFSYSIRTELFRVKESISSEYGKSRGRKGVLWCAPEGGDFGTRDDHLVGRRIKGGLTRNFLCMTF